MRWTNYIPLLFILLEACIDPLQIALLPGTQKFVVDGLITNEPGPYEVRLSYATSVDNALKKAPVVTGATVWIYDNETRSEKLSETSPGVYQTSKTGIQGVIGRSYYVKIKTKFGREYESNPQRLTGAGQIDSIYFEFDPGSMRGEKPGQSADGVKILLNSKGLNAEQNLMRWRWTAIFKAHTWPELYTSQFGGGSKLQANPLPCSGYIKTEVRCDGYDPECKEMYVVGEHIKRIKPCTCCDCWPYYYNTRALVSHNRIVDGVKFTHVNLGNIQVGTQEFYEKYYLEVEQLSLSEDSYAFWSLVEKQQSANGNLFQPNTAKVNGNIHSLTNPGEEVLGLFGVSGIARKEVYLTPDVVPFKLPPLDTVKIDCASAFENNYAVAPAFW